MTKAPKSAEQEVLNANLEFYRALQNLDLAKMEALWVQEEIATCLHPGWELLIGWEDVGGSWASIFKSPQQMRITISRPLAVVHGDVAWVNCIENITTLYEGGFSTASVEAVNIFLQREGKWLLVHHHAAPLPDHVPANTSRSIQ
jgi:ketosteroid isomerase-like protein